MHNILYRVFQEGRSPSQSWVKAIKKTQGVLGKFMRKAMDVKQIRGRGTRNKIKASGKDIKSYRS